RISHSWYRTPTSRQCSYSSSYWHVEERKTVSFSVRTTTLEDIPQIIKLCEAVYPGSPAWSEAQIRSHLKIFPEGQFVAFEKSTKRLVGMASSLIIDWDEYEI